MKPLPNIIQSSFSSIIINRLIVLNNTFHGLKLKDESKEFSLIDEIELYISALILGLPKLTPNKTKLTLLEVELNSILEKSMFSNLEISINDIIWNPKMHSFKEFKIHHLDDGELSIISSESNGFCLKDLFYDIEV